jgi:tetratricopeptide (TPR) repeat protein
VDGTNALQQARAHLNAVITQYTNSAHLGKAWLNLGWCDWEEGSAFQESGKIQESEKNFRTAMEKLTRSDDQALARFKVADAQYATGQYASAVTNYLAVIQVYNDLPQVRNSLFDKSYRKMIRAALDLKQYDQAAGYIETFRKEFPTSPLMEETVYLYGQALALSGRKEEARKVFGDFTRSFPNSPLCPDVQFAEARTFSMEGEWKVAIEKEERWLGVYTNHALRPEVEFQRASLYEKAGNPTNAFRLFTNIVSQFPLHPLAPAAQNWVADYYFNQEEWPLAEQNYQKIFQNTNWVASPFHFQSMMSAAKTAFYRQDYGGAQTYLMTIIKDERGSPAELRAKAWFELGDVIIEQPITGSTNKLNNYVEAAKIFDVITKQFTNRFTPMAWGKKGDCHMQLYPTYAQSFTNAVEAYEKVAQTATEETPVSVLNQAEYGLGLIYEKASEQKTGAEKEALQKKALEQYLNVVYGTNLKGKQPSPLYLKLAGRDAGRLAESLGETSAALELYKRLLKELPSMKTTWESRISALQQKLVVN